MAAPAKVKTLAEWQWPEDVVAYAVANQVQAYLEPMLRVTQRLFPMANWIKVYLEHDPEIRDLSYIVFDVQVSGLTVAQALELDKQWTRELVQCGPAPVGNPMVLRLDTQP